MTTYTNIQKPSNTLYTNINFVGKQQYDQVDIFYDDPVAFYDGININQYTVVTKPVSTNYTNIAKPN